MKSTLGLVAVALLGAGLTGATPLVHDVVVPEQAAVVTKRAEHIVRDLDVAGGDAAQGSLCPNTVISSSLTVALHSVCN